MAGIKDFKKVAGAEEDVAKLQERLQEFFTPIIQCPIIDGTLLTGVQLSGAQTAVEHKLNREFLGYIITKQSANAVIWQSSLDLPKRFINLTASAPVTVDIWVF